MKQFTKKLAVITVLSCSLQSCFVVGAAAGAAAIAAVYDHRTIAATLQDNKIANSISDKINRVSVLRNDSHIEVTVFNDTVLLTGETPSAEGRDKAGEIARAQSESKGFGFILHLIWIVEESGAVFSRGAHVCPCGQCCCILLIHRGSDGHFRRHLF